MKYLRQLCILLAFTFVGELLHALLPLPVPAAIYGLVLLFLALCSGIVRPEHIGETGGFLLAIMPVLFIAPAVGLLEQWPLLAGRLFPIGSVIALSTVLTFGVSGRVTQALIKKNRGKGND